MNTIPRHIAIVMDGNGRWAQARNRPRSMGHKAGVKAVRETVEASARAGIEALTLFAFSSENWKRPMAEVNTLMELFMRALRKEVDELHKNEIKVRFIGNLNAFSPELQHAMRRAEVLTQQNHRMHLNIAVNYGGRWDLAVAAQKIARRCVAGELSPEDIDEQELGAELNLHGLPEPDLLIRTGGERRLSNFMLWQMAYTELYFCPVFWPDFGADQLESAIADYSSRQRRFGVTPDQASKAQGA